MNRSLSRVLAKNLNRRQLLLALLISEELAMAGALLATKVENYKSKRLIKS